MSKQYNSNRSFFTNPVVIIIAVTVILVVTGVSLLSQGTNQKTDTPMTQANSGKPAPNFSLPSTAGKKITLSNYKGKKNVLIYFNEGLSCDPCMQQIPELEKYLGDFDKMNVVVLTVMYDPVDQLKNAESQYNIKKIPMLSYQNANTDADYQLTSYSMAMGRRAGHTFVLVDKNGKIIWRKDYWPGQGMSVQGGVMFVNGPEIVNEVKKALNI